MDPATTVPKPAAVLTSKFPSALDMIGWVWSHATEWAGAHWFVVVAGLLGAFSWYVYVIFSRAVKGV